MEKYEEELENEKKLRYDRRLAYWFKDVPYKFYIDKHGNPVREYYIRGYGKPYVINMDDIKCTKSVNYLVKATNEIINYNLVRMNGNKVNNLAMIKDYRHKFVEIELDDDTSPRKISFLFLLDSYKSFFKSVNTVNIIRENRDDELLCFVHEWLTSYPKIVGLFSCDKIYRKKDYIYAMDLFVDIRSKATGIINMPSTTSNKAILEIIRDVYVSNRPTIVDIFYQRNKEHLKFNFPFLIVDENYARFFSFKLYDIFFTIEKDKKWELRIPMKQKSSKDDYKFYFSDEKNISNAFESVNARQYDNKKIKYVFMSYGLDKIGVDTMKIFIKESLGYLSEKFDMVKFKNSVNQYMLANGGVRPYSLFVLKMTDIKNL